MLIAHKPFLNILFLLLLMVALVPTSWTQCSFDKNQGPPGEICTSAIYLCGRDLDNYSGRLPNSLSAPQLWTGLCDGGNPDNIIWFSFTPCQKKVTLELTITNCTIMPDGSGVQTGLYTGCKSFLAADCSRTPQPPELGATGTFTVSSDKFTPGALGYLFIDGFFGSVCDFSIKVIEGIDTQPPVSIDPTTLEAGAIVGKNEVTCGEYNQAIPYTLIAPQCEVAISSDCTIDDKINPIDSVCYVWQVSPKDGRYFVGMDSVGKSVELAFSKPGIYTISADSYFNPNFGGSCQNSACGEIISWQVEVKAPDTTYNQEILLCPNDNFSFCGTTIQKDTTIRCVSNGCDVVYQPFRIKKPSIDEMGDIYICRGSKFTYNGVDYDLDQQYSIQDVADCSLIHRFRLINVDVDVAVQSTTNVLNCKTKSIQLTGSYNTNQPLNLNLNWQRSGSNLGQSNILTIDQGGIYTFTATTSVGSLVCSDQANLEIKEDFIKPKVIATKPKYRCLLPNETNPVLTVSPSSPLTKNEWTSPLGGKWNGLSIQLDSINVASNQPYVFTAEASNGCTLDTSFIVEYNFTKPNIALTGRDLTCYRPKDTILLSIDIAVDSIRWTKIPNQAFIGSLPLKFSHVTDQPGIYMVEAMASSSKCWNRETIEIADLKVDPEIEMTTPPKWYCNTDSIRITPMVSSGQDFVYKWSTTDGIISSNENKDRVVVAGPGRYILNVVNKTNGCEKTGQLQIVRETNVPNDLLVESQDVVCFGNNDGQLRIIDANGGFEPYSYYINGQLINTFDIHNLVPGTYKVEVRDQYECTYSKEVTIEEPDQVTLFVEPEIYLKYGDVSKLTFTSNYDESTLSTIVWSNQNGVILGNELELEYIGEKDDTLSVYVATKDGCSSRATILIFADNGLELYFPNAFSPNGDGVNDFLIIDKNRVPGQIQKINIYDRFGNLVYHEASFDLNGRYTGWDGTFQGKEVSTGVYIMLIEVIDHFGTKKLYKDDLTIFR